MDKASVLYFEAVIVEKRAALRDLYAAAGHRPTLSQFLQRVTAAVKQESARLPPAERLKLETFADLYELSEWNAAHSEADSLTSTVLLGTVQIGEYLM